MRTTREEVQEGFSGYLRTTLRKNYKGLIPSAATFADDFNHRIEGDVSLSISQETARRWIRGECLPDTLRQKILAQWLGMDLNQALCCPISDQAKRFDPITAEFLEILIRVDSRRKQTLLNFLRLAA